MLRLVLFPLLLAATVPAMAQDSTPPDTPRAPDGSRAFGIEPYIGVMGGYHSFDREGRPGDPVGSRMEGWLVGGVIGVNIPLGPVVAGVEGNGYKGFNDIDWEYGVTGRLGFRAGESGLIYASTGYQWVNGRSGRGFGNTHDMMYGLGVEFGPRTIGLGGVTGQSGPRIRLEVQSYDFDSIRPIAGVIWHF